MAKHNITFANQVYAGGGYYPPMFGDNERKGVPINFMTKVDFGSPIALDVDYIMDAATSTELPDTETVTYTTADDGVSPFDNADTPAVSTITTSTGASASVWSLDVPRNLSFNVTHGSSIVAMTCVIAGYDTYGQAMSELFTITATGTTKTAAGAKAFAHIESIALTSAADAEANTANLGIGDVMGLPYALQTISDVIQNYWNDVLDTPTIVAADATTATTSTGDVRGTITPGTANDGSALVVWINVANADTEIGLRGVDQA